MKLNLDFYTQYSQFYIYDKDGPFKADSIKFWTEEAFNDRLAIEEGLLGIGTECYGQVKAEVNIISTQFDDENLGEYDHVVEAGIEIKSGVIQIVSCPDSSMVGELKVSPGSYVVRVYSKYLDTVEGDEGDDYYIVNIWPGELSGRNVLKQYL